MLFYCESKADGYVVLDVNSLESLETIWFDFELGDWIEEDKRSLIEINCLKTMKYKGFREGLWYDIPLSFWDDFKFDTETYSYFNEDRSLLFRLVANYKGKNELDMTKYRLKKWDSL